MPVDSMQKQESRNVGPEIAGGMQSEVFYPPARPARFQDEWLPRVKAREMRGPINESPNDQIRNGAANQRGARFVVDGPGLPSRKHLRVAN